MTPFEDAHEAGYEAFKAKAPAAFRDDDALLAYLTAALPHLRKALAEELRAEAARRDEEAQGVEAGCAECSETGQAWCDAADFVEGK